MKEDRKRVRELLPQTVKVLFDDIVEQRVLGASRHITMIGEMIAAIANEGKEKKSNTRSVIGDIITLAKFFIATRGEASQAVSNAIYIMIYEIDRYVELEIDTAVDKIIETKDNYLKTSQEATEKVVEYAAELARNMNTIFVFDYSSTVDKFLAALPGNDKKYTVYIAESRIIDGGVPFVETCQKAGFNIKFIPDASMMYYLKDCDAAFMGAETFYPDGTGFNTIGSDIVSLICDHYKIPLYFLTPFIKLDVRPVYGYKRELVMDDMKEKLTRFWKKDINTENIDFMTPELIGINAEYIKGFVTEKGIIPADQMYEISLEYSNSLRGDTYEQRI